MSPSTLLRMQSMDAELYLFVGALVTIVEVRTVDKDGSTRDSEKSMCQCSEWQSVTIYVPRHCTAYLHSLHA